MKTTKASRAKQVENGRLYEAACWAAKLLSLHYVSGDGPSKRYAYGELAKLMGSRYADEVVAYIETLI